MKTSGWIPLDKNLVKSLPRDRPFTELEAMFSVSVDFDNKKDVTVLGYAERWGWNRKTVLAFFEEIGVVIEYPSGTKSIRNKRGHIKGHKRDIKRTKKGQISFIDLSCLKEKRDIKGTKEGHKRDKNRDTTNIYPINPNPNPKEKIYKKEKNTIPQKVIEHLNKICGKNFSVLSEANQKPIRARQREGRTLEDFKIVIEHKFHEWGHGQTFPGKNGATVPAHKYLRPSTLFGPEKFENYLDQATNAGVKSLKTKEEVEKILDEAVSQSSEDEMLSFLKSKDKDIFNVVNAKTPFLFERKRNDYRIIYRNYTYLGES